jgi:hypothetical protein
MSNLLLPELSNGDIHFFNSGGGDLEVVFSALTYLLKHKFLIIFINLGARLRLLLE